MNNSQTQFNLIDIVNYDVNKIQVDKFKKNNQAKKFEYLGYVKYKHENKNLPTFLNVPTFEMIWPIPKVGTQHFITEDNRHYMNTMLSDRSDVSELRDLLEKIDEKMEYLVVNRKFTFASNDDIKLFDEQKNKVQLYYSKLVKESTNKDGQQIKFVKIPFSKNEKNEILTPIILEELDENGEIKKNVLETSKIDEIEKYVTSGAHLNIWLKLRYMWIGKYEKSKLGKSESGTREFGIKLECSAITIKKLGNNVLNKSALQKEIVNNLCPGYSKKNNINSSNFDDITKEKKKVFAKNFAKDSDSSDNEEKKEKKEDNKRQIINNNSSDEDTKKKNTKKESDSSENSDSSEEERKKDKKNNKPNDGKSKQKIKNKKIESSTESSESDDEE